MASVASIAKGEGPPPNTLETERRKTMTMIHKVEKELPVFKEKYLRKLTPQFPEEYQEFIQFVCDRNGFKRQPKNPVEFITLINKVRDAATVLYQDDVEQFETAVDTYHKFKAFIKDISQRLTKALDLHVGRYCHSYASETGSNEIHSVQFYENNITRWRTQIKEAFILLKDILRNIKESCLTLEYFLSNFPRIAHYMNKSLDVFPRVFNPMKDWVTSDEAYVKRLQEELDELKREKAMLDSLVRRQRIQVGGMIQSRKTRFHHHTRTVKERLMKAKEERRAYRRKEVSTMMEKEKLEATLYKKRHSLTKVIKAKDAALKDTNIYSSREHLVDDSAGQLTDEISTLENKMTWTKMELKNLKKQRISAQKEFHELQVTSEHNTQVALDIQDNAEDATKDMRDLDEDRIVLGEKVMAVVRIMEIKSDPNTVKVIYSNGYAPGREFEVSAALEEACQIEAAEVSGDWPCLDSPRRRDSRAKLPNLSARSEPPLVSHRRSSKSFDSWTKMSQDASKNALSRTLRSLRRQSKSSIIEANDENIVIVN